jgi:thioredoxin-related protein
MSTKTIQVIKGIIFLIISLYLAFTFNNSLSNFIGKIPIVGWVKGSIVLRLVISLGFARGVQLVYKGITQNQKPFLVFSIATLVGFTIVFITHPIYNVDYGNYGNSNLTIDLDGLNEKVDKEISLKSKNALIVFFSTDCSTCIEMSNKIGNLQDLGNTPQIIALFSGEEADAIHFLSTNKGTNFEYFMVENEDYFLEAADYSFPSLFLVDKKGSLIQHWEGTLMNYTAFDMINDYK